MCSILFNLLSIYHSLFYIDKIFQKLKKEFDYIHIFYDIILDSHFKFNQV